MGIGDWGLGIGDWGLGIGDWAQSPIPNPQSPIPNPQIFFKRSITTIIFNLLVILINYLKTINLQTMSSYQKAQEMRFLFIGTRDATTKGLFNSDLRITVIVFSWLTMLFALPTVISN